MPALPLWSLVMVLSTLFVAILVAAKPEPKVGAPSRPALGSTDWARLEQAARTGGIAEKLALAQAYLESPSGRRNEQAALVLYEEAAKAGSAEAALQLGLWHEYGEIAPQSFSAALNFYQLAADRGNPEGLLRMGLIYFDGGGVPADRRKAAEFITAAAEKGCVEAQRVLSDMYVMGLGVPKNYSLALQWAEKAAKAENPEAQRRMGNMLASPTQRNRTILAQGRAWYQKSAEKEHADAMLGMATSFMRSDGTEQDMNLATRWLELAMESGCDDATFFLALIQAHHEADGPARSLALLERASARRHYESSLVLEKIKSGQAPREAFQYFLTTTPEQRYLDRYFQPERMESERSSPTHMPWPVRMCQPVYPAAMQLAGKEGTVLVEFIVDTKGMVRNAVAIQATHPAFGERAVEAVMQWRFEPGRKDGRIVNTRMKVPVIFRISELDTQNIIIRTKKP